MTFEEARNIIAKDGFARYIVVKSESETPKYPSWNPMPCQSKAFVEAVRYLCLSGYEVLRDSEIDEYDKKHGFMTLDEAKKILEKEGYSLGAQGKPGVVSGAFLKYESPEICEAMQTVCSAGYEIMMFGNVFEARKERLQKEYEKNIKAPGSAENRIKEDSGVTPALKESASQFNDALLDEQAKKIEKLAKENERLKDQIAVLDACKKHNDKIDRLQIKRLGKEIARLNGIIHDKNAVLADVAEELRLSKIREKNLTEVSQKYMKENEAQKDLVDDISLRYDGAKHNLKLRIDECEELREKLAGEAKRVEMIRNASKEYCDYGVAANEFIKELASLYVLANNKGIINDEMLERCKNYQTYGFPANCNRETKKEINDIARGKTKVVGVDNAEEGGDHSAIIAQCCKNIAISKDESEIIERCTKNGTELHYSEKDGFTYTNMFGDEMPIICLRGMCQVFTDEEIKNTKK